MGRKPKHTIGEVRTMVPKLPLEERARRVEHFFDVWFHTIGAEGYVGCKSFPEENRVALYVDRTAR